MDPLNILPPLLTFGFGIWSGVLLERHRRKEATYQSVLFAYVAAMKEPGVSEDEYLRFGAFQRAGAWLLTSKQLKRLTDEIQGRGLLDPSGAWGPAFGENADFPRCALVWARNKNVDFTKPDAVLRALAADWDASKAPKPPSGPGVMFVGGL